MTTESQRKTWRQYEAGRNYKRQIGLYSRVEEHERFYRGDQWRGGSAHAIKSTILNCTTQ